MLIDDLLQEMANVNERLTGLPFIIHLFHNPPDRRLPHNCRLKVCRRGAWRDDATTLIRVGKVFHVMSNKAKLSGSELLQVRAWYKKNEQTILDFWHGKIEDDEELKERLVRYKKEST